MSGVGGAGLGEVSGLDWGRRVGWAGLDWGR